MIEIDRLFAFRTGGLSVQVRVLESRVGYGSMIKFDMTSLGEN